MTMKNLLAIVALAAAPLFVDCAAAQQPADPNERIQKLVTLKYIEPNVVTNLLRDFGVDIRWDPRSKVVALTGRRANVMTAEDAIKQLDVPNSAQKNLDMTVYFVIATDQSNVTGTPIPGDLQSTVSTLKSTFPFKNYALLDTLSLRTRSGVEASTSGQFGSRMTYFRVGSATLESEGGSIRLNRLSAGLRNPVSGGQGKIEYVDTGVTTEVVDVKEGQKLVIGRSSLDGPSTAIFLVLVTKVVQ
jgi:hypothetical protein